MGELVWAGLAPHPPIIVPEVGKRETAPVRQTMEAMRRLAGEVREAAPDTLIMFTPHGIVFSDAVAVTVEEELAGDLGSFGAPQVAFRFANDVPLAQALVREAAGEGITAVGMDEELAREYGASTRLDHGLLVPLYYLRQAGWRGRLLPVGASFLPYLDLYRFGMAVARAVAGAAGRVAVLASGDLSHRLTRSAPAGYDPQGEVFDREVRERLAGLDVPGLLNLPPALIERAGQCGLPSLVMLLGVLDGRQVRPQILSYEGPFGVGYLVASLRPGPADPRRGLLDALREEREQRRAATRARESAPVRLARQVLENYVREGRRIRPPAELAQELAGRAGCFVSLKKDGQLRGCIGTVEPTQPTLAEEIARNAIEAGTRDPRFDPVRPEELDDLTYSVDVLNPPEKISGLGELDPRRYGVIVRSGWRSGLLLPDLEGVDTAEEQVAIARRKAGIGPEEPVELERFTVTRYT